MVHCFFKYAISDSNTICGIVVTEVVYVYGGIICGSSDRDEKQFLQ